MIIPPKEKEIEFEGSYLQSDGVNLFQKRREKKKRKKKEVGEK
jgi:hypothetical protein